MVSSRSSALNGVTSNNNDVAFHHINDDDDDNREFNLRNGMPANGNIRGDDRVRKCTENNNLQSTLETNSQNRPSLLAISRNDLGEMNSTLAVERQSEAVTITALATASDEESYEGFGYARTNVETELELDIEGPGQDINSSAPSPSGPNSLTLKSTSPSSTIGRHSWSRTSLRCMPPGTARQRQLGSNALASQLYRSGSFNSSGRGSTCDTADDMYSDVSLEDDVIDLNHRVRIIQEQMHVLSDTRSVGEERYARVKQENATLQARILMLEEAAKDAEARAEEKLEAEQRRHREWASRLEREKQLQLENYSIKMQTIELENSCLRDQISRVRKQLDASKEDGNRFEDVIQDLRRELADAREAERHALLRSNEARVLLDAATQELAIRVDNRLKNDELAHEIQELRNRNKNLEESRDELQAAMTLQAGRELLMLNIPRRVPAGCYDTLDAPDDQGFACSLAVELSADAVPLDTRLARQPQTMSEMRQALKELQEVNDQLRSYIDAILLNVVENYPQLLEVKQANNG